MHLLTYPLTYKDSKIP